MYDECDRRRNPLLVRVTSHISLTMCSRHLSMRGACTARTPWPRRPSTGQLLKEGCPPSSRTPATRLPTMLLRFLSLLHTAGSTADSIPQAANQMGQSSASESTQSEIRVVDPPKPDVQVVGPPSLDLRVLDPPTCPPIGLALIAHGRNATLDCPVVGTLATYLRESHGCRTVTWSARGVGNSEGTKGPDSENRKDYNVSLVYGRAHTRNWS